MKEWWEEIMEAFKHLKIRNAPGPTGVYAEMTIACRDVKIRVLMEHCQRILDVKGMPAADWATSVTIPIFKGKGDIINCGMYSGVKLLEHAIKIVE